MKLNYNLDPALELSTLGCSSTHNTLHVLQGTALGPEPPKADPDDRNSDLYDI